jgi:hypothetical protein
MGFANVDVQAIVRALDKELELRRKSFFTPMEANAILAALGLLKDNPRIPGKNLRLVLNAGKLPHAYKLGGEKSHWVIPHSNTRRTLDKPYVE